MLDQFYSDLTQRIHGLGWIGLTIILLFAFFHVTFEGPLALFLLATATLILDSFGWAVVVLLLVHWSGLPLFYYLVHHFHRRTNRVMVKVHVTNQLLEWVDRQQRWQHMIVIGLPFIPTYPVKLALTVKAASFRDYMATLMGSYVIFYSGHSLIYWGVLSFLTSELPWWVGVITSFSLALLIYGGKKLFPTTKAST